jgi:tRNA(Arg) A34 adenosine deaminase TadA
VADGEGNIWVECFNDSKPPTGDPTCHAERLAAAQAVRILPPEQLASCTLYSSAEPCAMCAGAIYWCGIRRVVYGLSEARLLTLTGNDPENPTLSMPCREVFARGQHVVTVLGPFLEDEAAVPHHQFWRPDGD